MIEIQYPWLICLLPLPLLINRLLKPRPLSAPALKVPFLARLADASGLKPEKQAVAQRKRLQYLLLAVIWCALVTSLMRPEWLGPAVTRSEPGRDLLVAVDLSGSMITEDMQRPDGSRISRIEGLKQLLSEFIADREGDRLGLILFGSAPYLQVPFTTDSALFLRLLQEAQVPMAGPRTMLGDAIGLAIRHFESGAKGDGEARKRLMLLFTDGNDTGSKLPPLQAAEFAAESRIRIHTIALGDPATSGQMALDSEALQQISEISGGSFYRVEALRQLDQLLQQLDRESPPQMIEHSWRPRLPLYHWPMLVALLFALLVHGYLALGSLRRRVRDA